MTTLEFNSHFASNFEVMKTLGKGGFGIVFQAKNKIDEKVYAFKRIKLPTKEAEVHVMREVRALAKLKHNNIVRYIQAWKEQPPTGWQEDQDDSMRDRGIMPDITCDSCTAYTYEEEETSSDSVFMFEVSPTEGFFYIQMELCKEETLKTWIENASLQERAEHIEKIQLHIARGIHYIHQKGLIHRDLKPSNIFFSQNGYFVKIGDFGLVKDTRGNATACNEYFANSNTKYVGTRFYMSPEQKAGRSYDNKVDIYACGVIFFELLSEFNTDSEKIWKLQKERAFRFVGHPFEKYKAMLSKKPHLRPTIDMILEMLPKFKGERRYYQQKSIIKNLKIKKQ